MNSNKNIYWIMSALSFVGYVWIGFQLLHSTEHYDGFDFCLFKNLTGVPCPSCGITRSIIQLYHGQFAEAILINPIGLIAAFMLLVIPIWIGYDVVRGSKSMMIYYRMTERLIQNRGVYFPLIALLLLNWYWNIEKGL